MKFIFEGVGDLLFNGWNWAVSENFGVVFYFCVFYKIFRYFEFWFQRIPSLCKKRKNCQNPPPTDRFTAKYLYSDARHPTQT